MPSARVFPASLLSRPISSIRWLSRLSASRRRESLRSSTGLLDQSGNAFSAPLNAWLMSASVLWQIRPTACWRFAGLVTSLQGRRTPPWPALLTTDSCWFLHQSATPSTKLSNVRWQSRSTPEALRRRPDSVSDLPARWLSLSPWP